MTTSPMRLWGRDYTVRVRKEKKCCNCPCQRCPPRRLRVTSQRSRRVCVGFEWSGESFGQYPNPEEMTNQRITRETFDVVVQDKMKMYRLSLDEAVQETIRQFQLEGQLKSQHYDPVYSGNERYSYRDLPRDPVSSSWNMESRRDDILRPSYNVSDFGGEPSSGTLYNTLPDRWRPDDSFGKERYYRENMGTSDLQIRNIDPLRPQECSDYLPRGVEYGQGMQWGPARSPIRSQEHTIVTPQICGDFQSPSQQMEPFQKRREGYSIDNAVPLQDVIRPPGTMGKKPKRTRRGTTGRKKKLQRGDGVGQFQLRKVEPSVGVGAGKGGEIATKEETSKPIKQPDTETKDKHSATAKYSMQIFRWAKFNTVKNDTDLFNQHKALFRVNTEACKRIVECFKCPMPVSRREYCFSSVKFLNHPTLKNPQVDYELLDLLKEKHTIKANNELFDVIKPFDMEMMIIQQRLLRSAIPLLIACNTYELKHSILKDVRQLSSVLQNTVSLCRKSIVLLGQTFSMATIARQCNILEALGLQGMELKPFDCPNFDDSFLFGQEFMAQLKAWLKKTGHRMSLKTRTQPAIDGREKAKPKATTKSKEKLSADPKVIATIDELLENAVKGENPEGEKPAFWFLFNVDSDEYKYYRQKLADFQISKGRILEETTQTRRPKRSPEELACESVRAMLYARKAAAVKKSVFKSLAYSRRQRLGRKKKQPKPSKSPVKMEATQVSSASDAKVSRDKQTQDQPSTATNAEPQAPAIAEVSPEPSASMKNELSSDQQLLDVDAKSKDTAVKLAQFVVKMGPEIEQFSMENSASNPEFWFLHEKSSPAYNFYQTKVHELQNAVEEGTGEDDDAVVEEDGDLENIRTDEVPLLEDAEIEAECEAAEASPGENPLTAAFTKMPTSVRPPMPRKRIKTLKVDMLPPKIVCLVEEPKVHDPVRIEYDRPRGRGFKKRMKPKDLEFANKKLTQQNLGCQKISEMGWREGQGLGTSGSGIKNPIKVYVAGILLVLKFYFFWRKLGCRRW
ncbi:SURP and G-patch domain-containing protein 2-like isoform X3 [Ascaphus truei]|uniref:SURP and G-patch domain-containing protein 2-like isoform X3 n=1 Tax=Ascaphus truei TaxID=8439 RepID=UPI003F59620D